MPPTVVSAGQTAVITGGASGIGFAAASRFAAAGANVVLADRNAETLAHAAEKLQAQTSADRILAVITDVAQPEAFTRLREAALARFGKVHFLMNNAATGQNPGKPWEHYGDWQSVLSTNLGGVINGVQAFVPSMLAHGEPGWVVNTGSKQGVTLPPSNSAYNVSKAGVKAFTELLAHELRQAPGGRLSAHLLVPGFTHTGMSGRAEKPPAAWTPDQVVDVMLSGIVRGDFYLWCGDEETPRRLDERRIAWMAGDIIENRPALSRWHPDWQEKFAAFVKGE